MTRRSPFPGLDPYLEAHWGDVHHRLIQYSGDLLQDSLPDDLLARVMERVYLEDEDRRIRSIGPDTRIVEWRQGDGNGPSSWSAGGVAVAEPHVVVIDEGETTEGYLEIREADGGRVVTVIEFLSPANKVGGKGSRLYRRTQSQVLRSNASLVEVDLVRAGRHMLCVSESSFPDEWRNCSQAAICRSWRRTNREIYGFPLRERLPALAIPLRAHEEPIPLDLQSLLDLCYSKGRYDRIDYTRDCDPRLKADDTEWANQILTAAGLR